MALNKDMLKKMKMPESKMADSEADLDLESLGGGEEEAPEEEAAPEAGEETPEEENAELKAMPDEVLIEEMKRRGLIEEETEPGEGTEEVIKPIKK